MKIKDEYNKVKDKTKAVSSNKTYSSNIMLAIQSMKRRIKMFKRHKKTRAGIHYYYDSEALFSRGKYGQGVLQLF